MPVFCGTELWLWHRAGVLHPNHGTELCFVAQSFGLWHRAGVLHPNHGTEPVFFVFFHRTLTQNTNFQLYISYTQPAKRRKSMKKNRNLKNKDRSEYKKLHRRSEKKKSRDRRRQLKQGADYHVTCSINNMEHLMKPDEIKVLYEKVLAECKRKYVFLVIHFGIMDNHVHLIIRPGRESLSKIMQWLNSVFAMRFNRLTGRCGHVWKCRFWSKIIDRIEQFKAVFDYISFNPSAGISILQTTFRGLLLHSGRLNSCTADSPLVLRFPFPLIPVLVLHCPGKYLCMRQQSYHDEFMCYNMDKTVS